MHEDEFTTYSDSEDSDEGDSPQRLQQARLADLARQRARKREAQRLLEDLHAYQAQQAACRNLGGARGPCLRAQDSHNAGVFGNFVPGDCESGGSAAGDGAAAAQWKEHEARWAQFEASDAQIAALSDVPWPISATWLLSHLTNASRLHPVKTQMPADSRLQPPDARLNPMALPDRAAFRQASVRWHPDKFIARHGGRFCADVEQQVMAAVQALMQDINAAAAAAAAAVQ